MNTLRLASNGLVSLLATGACSKSVDAPAPTATPTSAATPPPGTRPSAVAKRVEAGPALPCDGPEMEQLVQQLRDASGYGDYDEAKEKAAIASVNGRRFAFSGCAFKSQGNDTVTFAPKADSTDKEEVKCRMAGGESGNRAFRDAAMNFDTSRLKLDVSGVAASDGSLNNVSYVLTGCSITPHE